MKENSIEENIKNAEHFINSIKTDKEYKEENGWHGYYNKEIVELARMLEHILSDYKRVLKENEELENITNKMIDYIMIHQQVKTMRKIFCKHCKLQNSCAHSGIHRNCVIRYFEYISKQGNINENKAVRKNDNKECKCR